MTSAVREAHRQRGVSLWPHEHGAYVTLLTPLVSALLFAPSLAALAWAVVASLLFVAHEPLLLLLGRRGARKRELGARAARRALLLIAGFAAPIGVALLAYGDEGARRALLVTGALCACAGALAVFGREKSLLGELLLTVALVGLTLPALAFSSVAAAQALRFALAWLLLHGLAVLTARAYVYRKREGEALLRWATAVALLVMVTMVAAAVGGHAPWTLCLAPSLVALVTFSLASGLFKPRNPKILGWALAATMLPAVVLIGLALR